LLRLSMLPLSTRAASSRGASRCHGYGQGIDGATIPLLAEPTGRSAPFDKVNTSIYPLFHTISYLLGPTGSQTPESVKPVLQPVFVTPLFAKIFATPQFHL